jgi:hypothetical protein
MSQSRVPKKGIMIEEAGLQTCGFNPDMISLEKSGANFH